MAELTVGLGVQHCPGPAANRTGVWTSQALCSGIAPGSRRAVCTTSGGGTPSGFTMLPSLSMLRAGGAFRRPGRPPITPSVASLCVEGSPWGEVPPVWGGLWPEPRGPAAAPAASGELGLGPEWAPGEWRAPQHHPRGESVDHVGVSQDHEVNGPQRRFLPVVTPRGPRLCSTGPRSPAGRQRVRGCGDGARAGCPPAMAPR